MLSAIGLCGLWQYQEIIDQRIKEVTSNTEKKKTLNVTPQQSSGWRGPEYVCLYTGQGKET